VSSLEELWRGSHVGRREDFRGPLWRAPPPPYDCVILRAGSLAFPDRWKATVFVLLRFMNESARGHSLIFSPLPPLAPARRSSLGGYASVRPQVPVRGGSKSAAICSGLTCANSARLNPSYSRAAWAGFWPGSLPPSKGLPPAGPMNNGVQQPPLCITVGKDPAESIKKR